MRSRAYEYARQWEVVIDDELQTPASFLGFGRRDRLRVVLKVSPEASGHILAAFGGRGIVRVYEQSGDAVLLERLEPGTPLSEIVRSGRDDEATDILAQVIRQLSPDTSAEAEAPAVEQWADALEHYLTGHDRQVPRALVTHAQRIYSELCASQHEPRLLHGDLHHDNILFDTRRGWLAIDPKGVVGELEYEIGAALRNPHDQPHVFTSPDVIIKRVTRITSALQLNPARVLAWAFSQAVLSVVWSVEDGEPVSDDDPRLLLASTLQAMLGM